MSTTNNNHKRKHENESLETKTEARIIVTYSQQQQLYNKSKHQKVEDNSNFTTVLDALTDVCVQALSFFKDETARERIVDWHRTLDQYRWRRILGGRKLCAEHEDIMDFFHEARLMTMLKQSNSSLKNISTPTAKALMIRLYNAMNLTEQDYLDSEEHMYAMFTRWTNLNADQTDGQNDKTLGFNKFVLACQTADKSPTQVLFKIMFGAGVHGSDDQFRMYAALFMTVHKLPGLALFAILSSVTCSSGYQKDSISPSNIIPEDLLYESMNIALQRVFNTPLNQRCKPDSFFCECAHTDKLINHLVDSISTSPLSPSSPSIVPVHIVSP